MESLIHCRTCGTATAHRLAGDEENGRLAQCAKCGSVHSLAEPPPAAAPPRPAAPPPRPS
jgi:uncharacterized Zn finger protein